VIFYLLEEKFEEVLSGGMGWVKGYEDFSLYAAPRDVANDNVLDIRLLKAFFAGKGRLLLYERNKIYIGLNSFSFGLNILPFELNIKEVLMCADKYIVLLDVPSYCSELNNIFCLDENAEVLWRVEDVCDAGLDIPNPMPYESVQIYEGKLYAHDSCGRDFSVDLMSGHILDCKVVK